MHFILIIIDIICSFLIGMALICKKKLEIKENINMILKKRMSKRFNQYT